MCVNYDAHGRGLIADVHMCICVVETSQDRPPLGACELCQDGTSRSRDIARLSNELLCVATSDDIGLGDHNFWLGVRVPWYGAAKRVPVTALRTLHCEVASV